ncbi:MAG: GPP34 family phosphoprotein [Akkermansiaceae bacterium]|nr:GPP34 family phosphoprotein [Armatimonadota bacterium]
MPEELLLLALDDATGNDNLGVYLDRALIAGALLDLLLQERIVRSEPGQRSDERSWIREPTYYIPAAAKPTGSGYLDHVFRTIAAHPMGHRLHSFATLVLLYLNRVNPLSPTIYAAPPNQRVLAAQNLLAREELIESETRFLGFMRRTSLRQGNRNTGESLLRHRLQAMMDKTASLPDERFRALLLLIKAMGLTANVFGKERLDAADWRVTSLLRLTMEPDSALAHAHRYIVSGIGEDDAITLKPVPF